MSQKICNFAALCSGESVEAIMERLESEGSEWSLKQLGLLKKMSPSGMKLTLRHLQESCTMELKGVLEMDNRVSQGCFRNKDVYEGIRAVLVDHDNTPVWGRRRGFREPENRHFFIRESVNSFNFFRESGNKLLSVIREMCKSVP